MTRRGLVIFLHWSAVTLILAMVKGGTDNPYVLAAFVAVVALWGGMTLTIGLSGRPGPKLSPNLRRIYPSMHRALHLLLALTAIAIAFRLAGRPLWFLDAWTMLLVTLSAGAFHGLFHFWRHTALYDGALRLILPRILHRYL